jgi:hypothetical protein
MAVQFSAYMSADQTGIASNTFTKLNFDTVVFQTGSTFDTTNKRWVPGQNGIYQISGGVVYKGKTFTANAAMELAIYKNGSVYLDAFQKTISGGGTLVSGPGYVISGLVEVTSVTDFFELWTKCNPFAGTIDVNGGLTNSALTWFNGAKHVGTPYISVSSSTNQTGFASATPQKIALDTVVFSNGGSFNTGLNRWTPGVAGRYAITGGIYLQGGGMNITSLEYTQMYIYVNGSPVKAVRTPCEGGTQDAGSWISALINLGASDFVEWWCEQGVGTGTSTSLGSSSPPLTWGQGIFIA